VCFSGGGHRGSQTLYIIQTRPCTLFKMSSPVWHKYYRAMKTELK
jgi:hypothetical protein